MPEMYSTVDEFDADFVKCLEELTNHWTNIHIVDAETYNQLAENHHPLYANFNSLKTNSKNILVTDALPKKETTRLLNLILKSNLELVQTSRGQLAERYGFLRYWMCKLMPQENDIIRFKSILNIDIDLLLDDIITSTADKSRELATKIRKNELEELDGDKIKGEFESSIDDIIGDAKHISTFYYRFKLVLNKLYRMDQQRRAIGEIL